MSDIKTIEAFRADLESELAAVNPGNQTPVANADLKAHNKRRSQLIFLRLAQTKWDADPQEPQSDEKGKFKTIRDKKVYDPIGRAIATGFVTSRTITIPPCIFHHDKKAAAPAPSPIKDIKDRLKALRNVTGQEWYFKLEAIEDLLLRKRIARLLWWGVMQPAGVTHSVIKEELVDPVLEFLGDFSAEQIAFELWKLGYPASKAMEKAKSAASK